MLFRTMAQEEDGLPRLGPSHLGVRRCTDIVPDAVGLVEPAAGGMSVTPHDPLDLPRARRPLELGGTCRYAAWYVVAEELPAELSYRRDPRNRAHGFIEPSVLMSFEDYVAAIHSTRTLWVKYHA